MPQEFQVLRCYQCSTFQVHQVKKAKKWSCKMCGEKQSVIKIGGDSIPSIDRWSQFVTSEQEEEDVAEDGQYDDRFTTDMAEFRQKQMTRKRKRNQKHDDYEEESSEQSQFDNRRHQSHARRRLSRMDSGPGGSYIMDSGPGGSYIMDSGPGGSYINVRQEDAGQSLINPIIQLQENKSHLQGGFQSTNSINSARNYNKGQGHRSSLDGYENDADQYLCYNEDQKDELFECQSGLSAGTGHGNYQDIKKVQTFNRGQGHYQVMTEGQSLNRDGGHHQVPTKSQSVNRGQGHHDGMKNNQIVSKWSKYEDESDSGEETCTLTEQYEKTNLSKKNQNDWNKEMKKSASDVMCVQSREERNREDTGTVLDSSVKVGKLKDLLNNTGSLTEKLTNPDRMWRQSQHKMWTGGEFSEGRKRLGIEGNDRRLKGDNYNSLIGLEEKQGNTDCQGKDGIINGGYSKCVRDRQPEAGFSEGTHNSYVTEHTSSEELPTVSPVTRCNQERSNVSKSEQRIGFSGHISRPLTQKSIPLQPMFVTEDITDEDLAL
ncbi:uncharacterized protein DDB_G0290685-like isoform X2 [Mizuhopecten yessoensis]|uniref:uncharacterized protein DDB_G0290685-like isoform X2 n=1 Tax=Mizuhopecten yessoensis TaxID=6573 RepID=UPI000B45DB28|nr:uncharacterized protein DDB_G0290685-like isoform X2 [Mizuhopecten yessoensis]